MACVSFSGGAQAGCPKGDVWARTRGRTERGKVVCPGLSPIFAGACGSSFPGYWRRKVMRALSLSYGDISIFTRSPMTRRMKRLRILPEM